MQEEIYFCKQNCKKRYHVFGGWQAKEIGISWDSGENGSREGGAFHRSCWEVSTLKDPWALREA